MTLISQVLLVFILHYPKTLVQPTQTLFKLLLQDYEEKKVL